MKQYFDKNDKEIKEGNTIKHDSGDTEVVVATKTDLGWNEGLHNGNEWEIYPLSVLNLKEWEVVE